MTSISNKGKGFVHESNKNLDEKITQIMFKLKFHCKWLWYYYIRFTNNIVRLSALPDNKSEHKNDFLFLIWPIAATFFRFCFTFHWLNSLFIANLKKWNNWNKWKKQLRAVLSLTYFTINNTALFKIALPISKVRQSESDFFPLKIIISRIQVCLNCQPLMINRKLCSCGLDRNGPCLGKINQPRYRFLT